MMLRKLKGKRLMFVGDSLQRGQWQSLVCLVDSVIPKGKKSMKRGRLHSVYRAKVGGFRHYLSARKEITSVIYINDW